MTYLPPIWPADLVYYCAAHGATPVNSYVQTVLTATSTVIDPTGVADSTAGIQAVVSNFVFPGDLGIAVLYFPPGTYKITGDIQWVRSGTWGGGVGIFGAGIGQTIFSVPNSTSAFSSAAAPVPIFRSASEYSGTSGSEGEGNEGFCNYFQDFTIQVGTGNPGCIGIDFLASNGGGGKRLFISEPTGTAYAGLLLSRAYVGPSLFEDCEVDGFVTPVDCGDDGTSGLAWLLGTNQYSIGFNNLTLKQAAGTAQLIRMGEETLNIDGLTVANLAGGACTVPIAKYNTNQARLNIIDWTPGNGSGVPAIDNTADGYFYQRNPLGSPSGWTAMIKNGSTLVPFQSAEWFTGTNIPNAFGQVNQGLDLTVPAIPVYNDSADPPSGWASVATYGAVLTASPSTTDYSTEINAAMASGAATVYFPGNLIDNSTNQWWAAPGITVPASVQRIIIGSNTILRGSAYTSFWNIETRTTPLFFECFGGMRNDRPTSGATTLTYNGNQPLVFNWVQYAVGNPFGFVINGTGPVFLKNFITAHRQGPGSFVYAWQLNNEAPGNTINPQGIAYPLGRTYNNGGTLRVFGMKTENWGTLMLGDAGHHTEIIGCWGLIDNDLASGVQPPLFQNYGGNMSVAGSRVIAYGGDVVPGSIFWDIGPSSANNPIGLGYCQFSGTSPTGGGPTAEYALGPEINLYSTRLGGPLVQYLTSNLGSATVSSGGTGAPAAGTVETWTVATAVDIPAASSGASPPTQFTVVDAAMATNPGLAEIILVTNVSGSTWTVVRGAEAIGSNGTTPVAHAPNWKALVSLTAAALALS